MTLILPQRTQKPRNNGITSIHDVGIPLKELESILFSYSDYLDIAKFGVGSAIVEPKLKEKINLYKSFSVIPYFGGTLFEKFILITNSTNSLSCLMKMMLKPLKFLLVQ